jgi:hypothetical protein
MTCCSDTEWRWARSDLDRYSAKSIRTSVPRSSERLKRSGFKLKREQPGVNKKWFDPPKGQGDSPLDAAQIQQIGELKQAAADHAAQLQHAQSASESTSDAISNAAHNLPFVYALVAVLVILNIILIVALRKGKTGAAACITAGVDKEV